MMRAPRRAALLALLPLILVSGCEAPLARMRAPGANVLLITIDTLRADHLGCYGYARETSPNLDAFAAEAVRFEAAFSPRGLTFPSIASLLTSKHVYSHGVVTMRKVALPQSHQTMAETLSALGYRTVEFNAHLAFSPRTGFHQGFDEFQLFHSAEEPRMVERAVEWLAEHRDGPFFMWLHSFGPHAPYQPPEPWRQRFTDPEHRSAYDGSPEPLYQIGLQKKKLSEADRSHIIALYDGKVAWVDHQLGVLLRGLDELGLRDDTLVIVTADHGEELFDHHLFFSHESSAYHGVLRVPLLMRLPGRLPPGPVPGERVVETIDVFPTVLDVLGRPPLPELQGSSLLPTIAGAPDPHSRYAFGSVDYDGVDPEKGHLAIRTIRSARWRYVHNPDRYTPHNMWMEQEELYDQEADPAERRNVVRDHPQVAAELRRELERWVERTKANATPREVLLDPELEKQLEALGYVETRPAAGPEAPGP